MRHIPVFTLLAIGALTGVASAQTQVIGVAAPLTGPSALLGAQIRDGAEAVDLKNNYSIQIEDDACTPEGGAAAAERFVSAKVAIVTGFLCTESIEAAMPILKEAGVAVIATGVRTDSLTDRKGKTGWPVVRYAPRADAELKAASSILGALWREELFAIIDDGTIYSRELSEGFRLTIEGERLKPVFVDTFRPQLDNQIGLAGRLRRSGATHVFAAGDRADLAILGRDAAEIGYELTIAGGEVLRSAPDEVDLAEGTLMIGLPEWAELADPAVVDTLRAQGIEPDGYVLPAYASVEIAAQTLAISGSTGAAPLDVLSSEEFQTVLGPAGFDAKGDRTDNPYRLYRYQSGAFIEVD